MIRALSAEIDMTGLLERLRSGDGTAQREFWDTFFEEVHWYCAKMLGQGLVANEMAVEVLTEFLSRYVHCLCRPESMGAYLKMMAIRRCTKERKRQNAPVYADMDTYLKDARRSPEDAANYRVLLPRLEECLKDLSPKAQRVLKLRYFGELTNEKIGQILGGSKQYIGRLIRRSHERLRECLERKESGILEHEVHTEV